MKIIEEIIEIWTEDKTFSKESVDKFIERTKKLEGWNFDEMARYICKDDEGNNYLVELQVPTKELLSIDDEARIEIQCYGFDGELKDYSADWEIECVFFDGNWNTVLEQMKDIVLGL